MKRFGVVAHRGSRATHPENTMAAFEHAIRVGADAIELDVVVTADGVLAVTHDPVTCAFHDLPPSIPRLEDVIQLASRHSIVFDIEAKECGTPHVEYARMLCGLLPERKVVVRSFEHDILRHMHALRPDLPLAAITNHHTGGWAELCRDAFAKCISPWHELVSTAEVARAHAAGLAVMPWTVNSPAHWDNLIAMNVDALIVDDPAALVAYREMLEQQS